MLLIVCPSSQELVAAAIAGDAQKVTRLLGAGVDVNGADQVVSYTSQRQLLPSVTHATYQYHDFALSSCYMSCVQEGVR
jgi:hypothetical protein